MTVMQQSETTRQAEAALPGVLMTLLSVLVLLIDLGLLVAGGFVATATRSSFADIFADFDMELPTMTEAFMAVPNWPFLLALAAVAVLLVIKEIALRRHALLNLCVNVVAWLFLLSAGVAVYLALLLPLFQLIESLTQP
jgi:hypothetical protein